MTDGTTDGIEELQETTLRRETRKPLGEAGGQNGRELALLIAKLADDVKASDIVLLDVGDAVGYADYFVVCTGNTDRQVKAIHDTVLQGVKDELRIVPKRAEGVAEASWILLDFVDVVLHAFTPDARDFYRLDRLYGDVPREEFQGDIPQG